MVEMLLNWRHSGFNVFCGSRIQPGDEKAMEHLARYTIRASFSQERMTYTPQESRVIYQSKDGKKEIIKKIFKHLGLWQVELQPPPKATGPTKIVEYSIDYSTSQLPASDPSACIFGAELHDSKPCKNERASWHLSWTAKRAGKWLAADHDFSVIDPVYPEAGPS
ncbi:MAG: transposase [Desulfobacteraceae bacterium]